MKNNTAKDLLTKNITVNPTLKAFSSYIACIGISLFIMYYFSGSAGILLAMILSAAFIFSITSVLILRNFITAEAELNKTTLFKGESFDLVIKLHKTILLPSPPVNIKLNCSSHLTKTSETCCAALAGKEVNTIKIPFTAVHSGSASVIAEDIYITDYLGIFSFKLKKAKNIPCALKASVYPNIPDVPIQTDFLKTTSQLSSNDDDEDETNETSLGSTGTPGYDHRTYYPGDPIKRINWKLSSKRDIYMIRLDEKLAAAGQLFILQIPFAEETDFVLTVRDNIIEGLLAAFTMLIRENREIIFFYPKKGDWVRHDIHTQADISMLQDEMSGFEQSEMKNALPFEVSSLGKTPICFTAATSKSSSGIIQIINANRDAMIVCAETAGLQSLFSQMWMISPDFELRKR